MALAELEPVMYLLLGFLVSLVLTPLAIVVARRTGLLDRPGYLKVHHEPVPYLGGVGVGAAVVLGLAPNRPALLAGPMLMLIVGTVDDAVGVSPRLRLVAQTLSGLALAVVVDTRLPVPLELPLVVLGFVLLTNGMNLLDGLDGVAGGITLASVVGFAVVMGGDGRDLALATTGGLVAFLIFNRPPARVYLGDGGASLLGGVLTVLLVLAWRPGADQSTSVAALLFVAYPAGELVAAVVRRVRSGRSPLTGDRRHSYDQLVASGRSTTTAAALCTALQSAVVLIGWGASHADLWLAAVITMSVTATLALLASRAGLLAPDPSPP